MYYIILYILGAWRARKGYFKLLSRGFQYVSFKVKLKKLHRNSQERYSDVEGVGVLYIIACEFCCVAKTLWIPSRL